MDETSNQQHPPEYWAKLQAGGWPPDQQEAQARLHQQAVQAECHISAGLVQLALGLARVAEALEQAQLPRLGGLGPVSHASLQPLCVHCWHPTHAGMPTGVSGTTPLTCCRCGHATGGATLPPQQHGPYLPR